ncbi:MAG: TPM domain-containing protein, partial [Syntrophales bacterium]
ATVKTVGENDPNDYANRLYQAWGIGKKGEDKGILIFLAVKEKRVRIETGYGVEGILPDGLVGEILDRYAIPAFKSGDYGKGLSDTMAAVSAVMAKEAGVSITGAKAPPQQKQQKKQIETERGIGGIGQILLLILAVFFLLGTRQGRALLPWLLFLLMSGGGGGRRGGDGFGGFGGGGFGGFGGGSSGGGGAGRDF